MSMGFLRQESWSGLPSAWQVVNAGQTFSPSLSFQLGGLNVTSGRKVLFPGHPIFCPGRLPVLGFTLLTPAPSGARGHGWQELPAAGWPWGKLRVRPRAGSQQAHFHLDGQGPQSRRPRPQVSLSSSVLPLPPCPAWPAPSEALRQPHCLHQALTRLAGLPGSRGLSKHLHGFS